MYMNSLLQLTLDIQEQQAQYAGVQILQGVVMRINA